MFSIPLRPADSHRRLEVVTSLGRLEALREPWNALADTQDSPLLRHEWFTAAARAFAPGGELAVVVVWEGGRLRAAAPLVHEQAEGVRRLRILGFQTAEPEAFLHDDDAALAQVCGAVARLGRPVVLHRLGAESKAFDLLQAAQRGRGMALVRPATSHSHWNPIAGSWETFEAALSSNRRYETRRRRKKLEAQGRVRFEALAPAPDAVDTLFNDFVRVEGSGWKAREGTALTQDAPQRAFLLDFSRQAAELGLVRLFFLRLDDRIIAGQLHVQFAQRLWVLKLGFDEAFSPLSPGFLLTYDILRYACEHGLQGLEHLGFAEDWQRRWPVEVRDHSSLRLYPVRPAGAVALAGDALKALRRRGPHALTA